MKRRSFIMLILISFCLALISPIATTAQAARRSQLDTKQGLLIDLGRHPLSESSLKRVISAAADQHFTYVVLHLSDNEHLSFQSTYLGNRASKTVLSPKALKRLVTFANQRQLQLVPDVDLPSHAGAILKQLKRKHGKTYRAVKLDKETLDYTSPKAVTVAKKIYRELDGSFKNQPYRDLIIGADEVPGTDGDYRYLTKFVNQLNRDQNKRGFTTVVWNDSILKKQLPKLDANIVVTYWSQSGNHAERAELVNRRAKRVSVPNLVNRNRQIINCNSYATYYQLQYIGNAAYDTYFLNYLRDDYTPDMFNEIDRTNANHNRTLEPSVTTRGTLISLWGHDSQQTSTTAIVTFIHRLSVPK
ncbi:family 20 glycosylhydrolase [Levilactobacillus humaensis]|uniref:family 20 glycosylhydrolase n=1 Tax=Levilactobacillus humaensis TaxID=2950375 RepID=UPI0021C3D39B|nr:family 20 glycosylhydrolase [Levilactobacillus humaensis]